VNQIGQGRLLPHTGAGGDPDGILYRGRVGGEWGASFKLLICHG
jgi:hypothetical protein